MSKPLTLSQLKDSLLSVVRMMSYNKGMYLDFSYKGKLYRMHIEDLRTPYKPTRAVRRVDLTKEIKTRNCPTCKKLMLNNVCMNSLCSTNFANVLRNKTLE